MELSKRLNAVASLVTEGASVADIGTDHGYIPIYLIRHGISDRVIAMDINRGPLKRAREHIREEGLAEQIETRLSDGMEALHPGEVEEIITAGMGGGLVIKILTDHPEVTESLTYGILQPQSEIHKVREFLNTQGYRIVEEDMVKEDGKYYPMMKVLLEQGEGEMYRKIDYLYGKRLLEKKHPVLYEYLQREYRIKSEIQENLQKQKNERIESRLKELEEELELIREAMQMF